MQVWREEAGVRVCFHSTTFGGGVDDPGSLPEVVPRRPSPKLAARVSGRFTRGSSGVRGTARIRMGGDHG